MLQIRSVLFAIAFYVNCTFWFIIALPAFLLPTDGYMWFVRGWAWSCIWLHRVITGTTVEVRGREHIPAGSFIVASKHQSVWETLFLVTQFRRPTYILKRELMWVPLLGWHFMRLGQIPIDRSRGGEALKQLAGRVRKALAESRQILIFPEGTRRSVDAPPAYKYGVTKFYAATGATVLPVALNAGLSWPRRRFLKFPYPVIVEYLEPIGPGLSESEFHALLQERIETATNRLVAEARTRAPQSLSATQASVES